MLIYKILRAEEWAELRDNGVSDGAPIDVADGFIHLSTAATVAETAAKYFEGVKDLKLIAYDDTDFGPELKYEVSRGGAKFPHIYAPLRLEGALWVKDLPIKNGVHSFPEGLE